MKIDPMEFSFFTDKEWTQLESQAEFENQDFCPILNRNDSNPANKYWRIDQKGINNEDYAVKLCTDDDPEGTPQTGDQTPVEIPEKFKLFPSRNPDAV